MIAPVIAPVTAPVIAEIRPGEASTPWIASRCPWILRVVIPPDMHAGDLAVESGQAAPILGDQHRIEGAVLIARNVQSHLVAVRDTVFWRLPLRRLAGRLRRFRGFLGALLIEMDLHLRAQPTLRQRLGQCRQDAGLAKKIARRAAFRQAAQQVPVGAHTRGSSARRYHVSKQNSGWSWGAGQKSLCHHRRN